MTLLFRAGDMRNNQQLPISLKIIAASYMLSGFWALFTLSRLETAEVSDGIGAILDVVYVFAGLGLLRLSSGWRKFCLLICWIVMTFGIVFVVVAIVTFPEVFTAPDAPSADGWIGAICVFGFYVWQYRTLTSPSIRHLFYD